MGIFSFLAAAITPITNLIDNLTTSGEEKRELHNALTSIENAFAEKVLDYEAKMQEMKSNIIITEAKSGSWLTANWRPLTMVNFLFLINMHYFGWLAFELAPEMWTVLQIGIGGYIAGRSAEKVIPTLLTKFGNK